jgi:DNA-binding NtrC family response regulator
MSGRFVDAVETAGLPTTRGQHRAPEPIELEASDGPGKGVRHILSAGTMFLGTEADCDLSLADPHVSRRHASIELLPSALLVRDLGSRNGTFYLNARITEARVPLTASIRVGKTTIQARPAGAPRPSSERRELHGLIGESPTMRRLFSLLERLGPSDCAVLISGETGTGKEAVARALLALSPRAKAPFVVFDCAAVSPELIEMELFGNARGAFTGAGHDRAGLLETANGGALLLDEIGELPQGLQPKLLRLLETKAFRRMGESIERTADVRIFASTKHDLEADVAAGRFRQDLFFRVAVAAVEVPPLRERLEDIPSLARLFAAEAAGFDVTLTPATLIALQCDPWPGNVRQLRNAVQRILALGVDHGGARDDAPTKTGGGYLEARDALISAFEHDYLTALLARHGNNLSGAAREAKIARSFLYKLLAKHGV